MGQLQEVKKRLADHAKMEWMIYEIFYANPIAFARKNLAIQLERYALGLPLVTPEEEQARMLDEMSAEDRAAWWRAENARKLTLRDAEFAAGPTSNRLATGNNQQVSQQFREEQPSPNTQHVAGGGEP